MIPAFWYLSNNFGDALTPYIIRKISGKMPVWVEPTAEMDKYLVTGSILNVEAKNTIIWGCGVAESYAEFPKRDVRCVRGRLTLEKYSKARIKENEELQEIAVGDPCLLLPIYYQPEIRKRYKIGIIPHYIEAYYMIQKSEINLDIKIIDVNQEIEKFVDDLLSCEVILSSSLHGIICADAYGIPSSYVKFTDRIGGDGFKYEDWFSNFYDRELICHDFSKKEFVSSKEFTDIAENNNNRWIDNIRIKIEDLVSSCPFK
jgi:pyruvyltransferase